MYPVPWITSPTLILDCLFNCLLANLLCCRSLMSENSSMEFFVSRLPMDSLEKLLGEEPVHLMRRRLLQLPTFVVRDTYSKEDLGSNHGKGRVKKRWTKMNKDERDRSLVYLLIVYFICLLQQEKAILYSTQRHSRSCLFSLHGLPHVTGINQNRANICHWVCQAKWCWWVELCIFFFYHWVKFVSWLNILFSLSLFFKKKSLFLFGLTKKKDGQMNVMAIRSSPDEPMEKAILIR